jgi:hypothetical protein
VLLNTELSIHVNFELLRPSLTSIRTCRQMLWNLHILHFHDNPFSTFEMLLSCYFLFSSHMKCGLLLTDLNQHRICRQTLVKPHIVHFHNNTLCRSQWNLFSNFAYENTRHQHCALEINSCACYNFLFSCNFLQTLLFRTLKWGEISLFLYICINSCSTVKQ